MQLAATLKNHKVAVGVGAVLLALAALLLYRSRQAAARAAAQNAVDYPYGTGPYAATTPPLGAPAGDIVLSMPLLPSDPSLGGSPPPSSPTPPTYTTQPDAEVSISSTYLPPDPPLADPVTTTGTPPTVAEPVYVGDPTDPGKAGGELAGLSGGYDTSSLLSAAVPDAFVGYNIGALKPTLLPE